MAPAIPIIMAVAAAASVATTVDSILTKPSEPSVPNNAVAQNQQSLEAAQASADKLKKRQGLDSTMLTGPLGVTSSPQTSRATLGA